MTLRRRPVGENDRLAVLIVPRNDTSHGIRSDHSIAIVTPLALPPLRSISEETGWRLRVPEGSEDLQTHASAEYWLVFEAVPPLAPGTESNNVAELWGAPRYASSGATATTAPFWVSRSSPLS